MPSSIKTAQLLRLAQSGPLRARDLDAAKIPRAYLRRLTERNLLEHVGRGLYRLPHAEVTELHSLAEVAKRVPHATICLLSALQVHGLTTEAPHAVWVMIDTRARTPKVDTPTLQVVRAHGRARVYGVTRRKIEGVDVPITTPPKTVADCFRYRRYVGLDVALDALREYLKHARKPKREVTGRATNTKAQGASERAFVYTVDALVTAAKAARVYTVLRPYLEALA